MNTLSFNYLNNLRKWIFFSLPFYIEKNWEIKEVKKFTTQLEFNFNDQVFAHYTSCYLSCMNSLCFFKLKNTLFLPHPNHNSQKVCIALKLLNKYLIISIYIWVQFRAGLYFSKMYLDLILCLTSGAPTVNISVQMHNTAML